MFFILERRATAKRKIYYLIKSIAKAAPVAIIRPTNGAGKAPTAGRTQGKCCGRTMTRADLRAARSEVAERRVVVAGPPLLETFRSTT
jgi:hypothetical protein